MSIFAGEMKWGEVKENERRRHEMSVTKSSPIYIGH
jgi:hypothetical protein